MRPDEDIVGDFPAYALGALDQDAQRAVEDLAERDTAAADELAEMLDTVAVMSARIGEDAPPAPLRDRLIAAVKAEMTVSTDEIVSHQAATRRVEDEDIIRNFPAYALDTLDEESSKAVEDLVERDAKAAEELAEMLDTVAGMSARIGEATPPDALRQRLVAAVRAESGYSTQASAYSTLVSHLEQRITNDEIEYVTPKLRLWDRMRGAFTAGRLAFATSVASFAVVVIMAAQLGADNVELNQKISQMEREVAAAYTHTENMIDDMSTSEQLLTQAHDRISRQDEEIVRMSAVNDALRASMNDQISLTYATLRNEYTSPDWQPDAVLSRDGYAYLLEHRLHPLGALVIGGVEPAPHGEEYRLYLIGEGRPHYVASFDMNEAGYGTVLFDLPSPLNSYNGAHITRELIVDPPDPSLASPENRYEPQ